MIYKVSVTELSLLSANLISLNYMIISMENNISVKSRNIDVSNASSLTNVGNTYRPSLSNR